MGARVLVVDEDAAFRRGLCSLLEPALEVVGDTGDVAEAAELARDGVADLIVVDVASLRRPADDSARALLDPAVAVVVLTDEDDGVEAHAAAVRAYLKKSSDLALLAPLIVALAQMC